MSDHGASAEKAAAASEAGGHGGKAPSKVGLWTDQLERLLTFQWLRFREILIGLKSRDLGVFAMSWIFMISISGAITVMVVGVFLVVSRIQVARKIEAEENAARSMAQFLTRQAEEAKRRSYTIPVGEFTFELVERTLIDNGDGSETERKASTGMAEAEVVVECDTEATCLWVEKSLPAVRNQVTNALIDVDRNELIDREGKRRIRKLIQDRLNGWIPEGQIQNVYISRLTID